MAEQGDTGLAWSCAANLRLHENTGPRHADVDRRDALVGRYARQILLELDADYPRILALRAECRQLVADARRLPEAWRVVQARRRRPLRQSWPKALRALSWSERRDRGATWALGAELAQRAVQIITEAGAQLDEEARAALLAGMLPAAAEARDAARPAEHQPPMGGSDDPARAPVHGASSGTCTPSSSTR